MAKRRTLAGGPLLSPPDPGEVGPSKPVCSSKNFMDSDYTLKPQLLAILAWHRPQRSKLWLQDLFE